MRDKIKLISTEGTGHFYTTTKNKRTMPEKWRSKNLILLFVNTLFTKKQKSNNYLALTTSFRFAFLKRLLLALSATAP